MVIAGPLPFAAAPSSEARSGDMIDTKRRFKSAASLKTLIASIMSEPNIASFVGIFAADEWGAEGLNPIFERIAEFFEHR